MKIKIHKPGPFSTIQDLGRMDYLSSGVPQSGAMDTLSARLANSALGNADGDAVIEFTYAQAEIEILSDMLLAYAGAGAVLVQGEQILPANRPLALRSGSRVKLIAHGIGCRTYLAAPGGWDVATVMSSKSTYLPANFGGLNGRLLQAADELQASLWSSKHEAIFTQLLDKNRVYPTWTLGAPVLSTENTTIIRVTRGAEADWFESKSQEEFLAKPYDVGRNSNRMGYALQGNTIQRKKQNLEMLSTAVLPGTIQVPGNGQPIMLMADCQTTGGYPRIAQVVAVDLARCGQLKPGDRVRFQEISLKQAENLYLEQEQHYRRMKLAVEYNYSAS